jgi:hypothetical protein
VSLVVEVVARVQVAHAADAGQSVEVRVVPGVGLVHRDRLTAHAGVDVDVLADGLSASFPNGLSGSGP